MPEAFLAIFGRDIFSLSKAKMEEKRSIFIFDEFDKKNIAFMYVYNMKTIQ